MPRAEVPSALNQQHFDTDVYLARIREEEIQEEYADCVKNYNRTNGEMLGKCFQNVS